MSSGSEAGSYFRLIEFVSLNTRLESNKEEEKKPRVALRKPRWLPSTNLIEKG